MFSLYVEGLGTLKQLTADLSEVFVGFSAHDRGDKQELGKCMSREFL